MNDLAEMSLKELCETARKEQIQIEIRIEPCEYGGTSTTVSIIQKLGGTYFGTMTI